MYWNHILHDGSPWVFLACLAMFAGVVIGLYTDAGRGITFHAYTKSGGQTASDLPPESIGRAELEPLLWRRAHRRAATSRRPQQRVAITEATTPPEARRSSVRQQA